MMNEAKKETKETAAETKDAPKAKAEPKAAAGPRPNVCFVGRHRDGTPREVPAHVNCARRRIDIPANVKHGEGFHSPDAAALINGSRDFKAFVSKGEK